MTISLLYVFYKFRRSERLGRKQGVKTINFEGVPRYFGLETLVADLEIFLKGESFDSQKTFFMIAAPSGKFVKLCFIKGYVLPYHS